jgi:CBS domain-containing protein
LTLVNAPKPPISNFDGNDTREAVQLAETAKAMSREERNIAMKARDVMTPNVITVNQDSDVTTIAKLLVERRISAVPVVDKDGKLVGIVSEGDLLHRAEEGTEEHRSWWLSLFDSPDVAARAYAKSHGRHASEIMTNKIVSVSEDTPVAEIAGLLEKNHIKRVPVLRDGKPVGIVSRANLVQALATRQEKAVSAVAEDDRVIRDHLIETLRNESWANAGTVNIVVENGEVNLWGMVDSEDTRNAIHVAIENTPGVKSIADHMGMAPHPGVGYV